MRHGYGKGYETRSRKKPGGQEAVCVISSVLQSNTKKDTVPTMCTKFKEKIKIPTHVRL